MKKYPILLVGLLLPIAALAHGAHGTDFVAGFTHPIFGLDHRMAIFGLSFLVYRFLDQQPYLPILFFVGMMVIGGLLGVEARAFGITEMVIVSSVFILGLILAMDWRLPLWAFALLAAVFGFFHGHAHGVEMPRATNIAGYLLGYISATAFISILGMALARWLNDSVQPRLVGAFIAGMGLMMFNG